jgi:hypothetical protein
MKSARAGDGWLRALFKKTEATLTYATLQAWGDV